MIVHEPPKRLDPLKCPLCSQYNDIIVNGHFDQGEDKVIDRNRGYAFCNCRNIFYTGFYDQFVDVYDHDYTSKYNAQSVKKLVKRYSVYLDTVPVDKRKKFLEIGAASDALLEEARVKGWDATGLDIMRRDTSYPMWFHNFETWIPVDTFDYIFASHVWEHFKDPIAAVKKAYDMLNDGGELFISMPDPYFIDWKNPYTWGHWHLQEHHIMWDMDSFCRVLEDCGFLVETKMRNPSYMFICIGDYHIKARKCLR